MNNRSTNINELPTMQQITNQQNLTENNIEEDNTIHEVLQEIENENFASQQGNPPPPVNVIQQNPPQPQQQQNNQQIPNITQTPPTVNIQQQQTTDTSNYSIEELLKQKNLEEYIQNIDNKENKSFFSNLLNELQDNLKLILVIISTFVLLNLDFVKNFILNKVLIKISLPVPHLNLILAGIVQSIFIIIFKIIS